MYLVRLIYVSTLSEQCKPEDIEQILHSARKYNAQNHVSGILFFNPKFFLQCLEGPRSKVNQTYQKILGDHRHNHIIQLQYHEISQRDFSAWSMAYLPDTQKLAPIIKTYSLSDTLDPYTMNGESALQLLLALKNELI